MKNRMINFDRSKSLDEEELRKEIQRDQIQKALGVKEVAKHAAMVPFLPAAVGGKIGKTIGGELGSVPGYVGGLAGGAYLGAKLLKQAGKLKGVTLGQKLAAAAGGALAAGTGLSIASHMSDVDKEYMKNIAERRVELVPTRYYLVQEKNKMDVSLVGSSRGYTTKQEAITVAEEIESRSQYSVHCLLGSTAVKNWPRKFRAMNYDD